MDGGLTVLLVERGDERNDVTFNVATQDLAFLDECVEKFSSDGVIIGAGNCMGGKKDPRNSELGGLLCYSKTHQSHN